jgi:hypothetical protein
VLAMSTVLCNESFQLQTASVFALKTQLHVPPPAQFNAKAVFALPAIFANTPDYSDLSLEVYFAAGDQTGVQIAVGAVRAGDLLFTHGVSAMQKTGRRRRHTALASKRKSRSLVSTNSSDKATDVDMWNAAWDNWEQTMSARAPDNNNKEVAVRDNVDTATTWHVTGPVLFTDILSSDLTSLPATYTLTFNSSVRITCAIFVYSG